MKKTFPFLIAMFIFVFIAGFLIGYFSERTGMLYTQSEIEKLRSRVENMQLQEMFIAGEHVDCNLMYSTMSKTSWELYDLVERLKVTSPESQNFYDLKSQADIMSLRAWLIARNVRQKCEKDIVPVLYLYSGNCPACDAQSEVLTKIKNQYPQMLAYAIDFNLKEDATQLVKMAYNITTTPTLIINQDVYNNVTEEELRTIICSNITC